ncbi:PhIL1-interacting candidate PIC1, putative [Plasmodium vivax]|nr:PhIL1-interacting candidate PIC1, putative [Plasmodium vivax]
MKLQYHLLLFTFLLSEDVLCYKGIYEGAKDGSAAAKQGGSAGSDYLTIGGKKVLWPGGGNDQKGEGNKSSNPQGGLLSSLLGSVKRLLFPNGKEMESHVQGISDNVIEMKEGVIKNSSNIVKHANKLKEELQKNTAYWANVVKTTVSEELHQIDKFSKDQLDRLRNDPESKFFFTKLFQAGGEAAGKAAGKAAEAASASSTDEKKAKSGAVGGATPKGRSPHDDAEVEEEEKAKSFWDLLHIGGGNAPPPADGKEPTTGFLRMFKGDTPKVGNSSEKKEPLSWFGSLSSADGTSSGKDPPQKSSANGMKGPEEKKMSFFSHFTSKGEKEEGGNSPKGSATQKNHPNGEKEKNQGFTFNFFKGKDSSQEQPPSDNQQSDSHPSEKGSLFQWFNPPPKEVNNDGHLPQKEQSGGTTKDSVKGSQDGEAEEEQGKNHSFSLLNMWKGTHKENAEKPQGEAETGVGSNSSQVIKGDSSEEATKGGSFFFNPFGGFKSDGESSHGGEASPAETTNAEGMAQSELGKKNSHLVDFIKNVYHGKSGETGEGAEKVLSLMNTEHEHNVSTNCHPLVSFKACLSTCFTIPPMVEGGSNDETKDVKKKKKKKKMKKNLSVGDYKQLEKCILKCRNKNFSERAAGCATKDGSIVAGEKGGYEENLKGLQKSRYNLGGEFSAFSDLTLSDKYADGDGKRTMGSLNGDGKQGVGSIDGEILSANSAWVMDASGKQLGGSQAELQSGSHVELQSGSHVELQSGSPTELQSGSHVELQSDSPTEPQHGSHVFPNLPDSTLGTHLYSPNSSKSITGGEKKQPADRRNNPVGENSFSFFKTFAPQTGPTSDGVNPLAAANPSEEPPNGKSWAAAGGAPGKGPEGANHGTSGGSASGGSSSGEADEEEEEEEDFNDFSYVSKGFFLLLLLVTFSVYLSAFTNIITQFYVSFKEKVCLYVKGQYRSRFDQAHAESAEAFLPKGRQHSYGNAVHGSYDNLYHAFQESACDVA